MIQDACVISTGTEILQGLYEDSNARYLSERLSNLGICVKNILTAPDEEDIIENTVRFAAATADLIICTGGLGPTEDDRNQFVFSRVAGVEPIHNDEALEMIRERFTGRNRTMSESNRIQALLPAGAVILKNDWGTAPGFVLTFNHDGKSKTLVALPGPPSEMVPMFEQRALPVILEFLEGTSFGKIRTYHTFGYAESIINDKVRDLFRLNPDVQFTILARSHGIDLRIQAKADTEAGVESILQKYDNLVSERLLDNEIYGIDDQTLPGVVTAELLRRNLKVATAESCTAGYIGKLLTDQSGSSACYEQGFITYSNDAKIRLIGVSEQTLDAHGAVSEQTAKEMATRVREKSGTDFGLAVTGISGPTGETPGKPVGLTYWAVSTPDKCFVEHRVFPGNREQNRYWAALSALNLLRKTL